MAPGALAQRHQPEQPTAGRGVACRDLPWQRLDLMQAELQLNDRIVLRARHYGALPELVTRTDLLAIVPLMYANSLAPRCDVRIWQLPEHGSRYDVHMVWHQTASLDLAHSWLRGVVRKLFQRT